MISMSLNVPKIYDYVIVKVLLFYKFSTYQPFLFTIEGNACEFIRKPPKFSVEKHVYDVIQETVPVLLTPCPTGNNTYNITWYLQDRHAPKNLPAGDYKLQFKLIVRPNVTLFVGTAVKYCDIRHNLTSTGTSTKSLQKPFKSCWYPVQQA
uniref:Uncharacterized protein n=1 Tax=Anopheles culicifacies TaxID=139723 RepID=A0A182M1I8_9DIPT